MKERYKYERVGWNFRLTDLQAAVAIPQLEVLNDSNKKRNLTAQRYNDEFSQIENLITPYIRDEAFSVWHQYSLRLKDATKRENLIENLHSNGIGAGVYYPKPVFEYEPYMNNNNVVISSCDVTREVCESVFSIPVHHYLSDQDIERVIEGVKNASN